jgi:uncharacterized membrane protein YbhN (UPF0104 family)
LLAKSVSKLVSRFASNEASLGVDRLLTYWIVTIGGAVAFLVFGFIYLVEALYA